MNGTRLRSRLGGRTLLALLAAGGGLLAVAPFTHWHQHVLDGVALIHGHSHLGEHHHHELRDKPGRQAEHPDPGPPDSSDESGRGFASFSSVGTASLTDSVELERTLTVQTATDLEGVTHRPRAIVPSLGSRAPPA